MGVWGSGLYSGDFATDLRAAVRSVTRLPFDSDRLVEILTGIEPSAANNPSEDHTTFWLVVADQFASRGISSDRVREKALQIIDEGIDIGKLQTLGMKPPLLKKRQSMLAELRARVTAPAIHASQRVVLKKPQPLLMNAGDTFIYPTSQGRCINSYFPSKDRMPNWKQDGWCAALIVEVGRVFEFLAWYRPLILVSSVPQKPDIAQLRGIDPWALRRPGTCSPVHFKRMELEKIGTLAVDLSKVNQVFPDRKDGRYQVVNDISLANELSTAPYSNLRAYPKLNQLTAILSQA